ncbi:MAG: hypothetical protein ABMA14_22610 [Hyphomonadaceae bacterium]
MFVRAFVGQTCEVARQEHRWAFSFGTDAGLGVETPWRIVTGSGIAFADTDDHQKFGLPQPVDGQARSNELLGGRRVISFDVDIKTADIQIRFEGDLLLEVFNNSSGYEGWNAAVQVDGQTISVVGLGGGDLAIY